MGPGALTQIPVYFLTERNIISLFKSQQEAEYNALEKKLNELDVKFLS